MDQGGNYWTLFTPGIWKVLHAVLQIPRTPHHEAHRSSLRSLGRRGDGWAGLSAESPNRVVKALLDTNILIDFLRGVPAARDELNRYEDKAISIVTWMEVMAGAPILAERATRDFLDGFALIELNETVAERAVTLRRKHRLKLPDAIVWASARVQAMLLVTRDTKGFPTDDPGVRMPYRI